MPVVVRSQVLRRIIWVTAGVLLLIPALLALHPRWATVPWIPANLVPLNAIRVLFDPGNTGAELQNLVGNLAIFVPAGVLLGLVVERGWVAVAIVAVAATMVELIQWYLGNRVVDIDDVLLAIAGAGAAVAVVRAVGRSSARGRLQRPIGLTPRHLLAGCYPPPSVHRGEVVAYADNSLELTDRTCAYRSLCGWRMSGSMDASSWLELPLLSTTHEVVTSD